MVALQEKPLFIILQPQHHSDGTTGRRPIELTADNTPLLRDSSTPQRIGCVRANIKLKQCSELYSQTQDPTANWNVIQNEKFNTSVSREIYEIIILYVVLWGCEI
jgi:hypothetical protein